MRGDPVGDVLVAAFGAKRGPRPPAPAAWWNQPAGVAKTDRRHVRLDHGWARAGWAPGESPGVRAVPATAAIRDIVVVPGVICLRSPSVEGGRAENPARRDDVSFAMPPPPGSGQREGDKVALRSHVCRARRKASGTLPTSEPQPAPGPYCLPGAYCDPARVPGRVVAPELVPLRAVVGVVTPRLSGTNTVADCRQRRPAAVGKSNRQLLAGVGRAHPCGRRPCRRRVLGREVGPI